MIVYNYKEYPDEERLSKMTLEELKAEIKRLEEENKKLKEWPKVE